MNDQYDFGFPRTVSRCDQCYDVLPEKPVIVHYQILTHLAEYKYCCEDCKWEHKLLLQREAGF